MGGNVLCPWFGRDKLRSALNFLSKHYNSKANPYSHPSKVKKEGGEPDSPPSLGLREQARKQLGIAIDTRELHIAVVGAGGVGKSSFINAIRLIEDTHEDAAQVGEVETTRTIARFHHPKLENIVLWDFPGIGTQGYPYDTYFTDLKLYAFDCIFILSFGGFLQVDYDIAKSALAYGIKSAFVYTKSDISVKAIAEREKVSSSEAIKKLRESVYESFVEGLEHSGLSWAKNKLPLFMISNRAFTIHDAYEINAMKTEESQNLEMMDEDKVNDFMANIARSRL